MVSIQWEKPVSQESQSRRELPTPLLDFWFSGGAPGTIILRAGLNGERLRFPLHIWYCSTSLQVGSPVNRAIGRITGGMAHKAWCGPVVVLKFNGSRCQQYCNVSLNDLGVLSAYFLNYN